MHEQLVSLDPFTESDYDTLISWVDNAEMLMQFAGPAFTYPLTRAQLERSQSDANRYAFKVALFGQELMIGYAKVYLGENIAYLGRLLIADPENRNKGLGASLVYELLDLTFIELGQKRVALNVFDWNKAAIRCYEKAGFVINPNLKVERFIDGQSWTALNMTIDQADWMAKHDLAFEF
ncbi:MAG: hypothetical protein JWP88_1811 [Flaviaesturariibacter sp.]|nr:hypothetical protein [Flaviaesturariibacter sp.]